MLYRLRACFVGGVIAGLAACAAGPARHRTTETGSSSVALIESVGRTLFFDARLSRDGQSSCATCHQPDRGFADGQRFSTGIDGKRLKRHTPHLFNLAKGKTFFWDGRATSLEEQAVMVMASKEELNLPVAEAVERLGTVPYYVDAFSRAFPGEGLTAHSLPRTIAAYVRSIQAGESAYDRYRHGDSTALGESARRGLALFTGRAGCARCHAGSDFTDFGFHNTAVGGPDGGRASLDREGSFRMKPYPFFQTHRAFKTPSLRNVALTAPYFHDGSAATLLDVLRFYNRGGNEVEQQATSPEVRPLGLTDSELHDLASFLESLSGSLTYQTPTVPGVGSAHQPINP